MAPSGIVKGNELPAQAVQILSILRDVKIDLVVLDGPKEALNVSVIGGTAFPIHGDTDRLQALYIPDVLPTGKLCALIAANDPRLSLDLYSLFKRGNDPAGIHRIRDVPADVIPAVNIDDGRQLPKPFAHR